MAFRKKVPYGKSKRDFTRGAQKVHRKNFAKPVISRGGGRL